MSYSIVPIEPDDTTRFEMGVVMERANAARDGLTPLPNTPSEKVQNEIDRKISTPDSWTFAAIDQSKIGNTLLGFATGYHSKHSSLPTSNMDTEYLALLMVDPLHWRRGVARALVKKTLEHCSVLGRNELRLWTARDNNLGPQSFYENMGFSLTGATRLPDTNDAAVEFLLEL